MADNTSNALLPDYRQLPTPSEQRVHEEKYEQMPNPDFAFTRAVRGCYDLATKVATTEPLVFRGGNNHCYRNSVITMLLHSNNFMGFLEWYETSGRMKSRNCTLSQLHRVGRFYWDNDQVPEQRRAPLETAWARPAFRKWRKHREGMQQDVREFLDEICRSLFNSELLDMDQDGATLQDRYKATMILQAETWKQCLRCIRMENDHRVFKLDDDPNYVFDLRFYDSNEKHSETPAKDRVFLLDDLFGLAFKTTADKWLCSEHHKLGYASDEDHNDDRRIYMNEWRKIRRLPDMFFACLCRFPADPESLGNRKKIESIVDSGTGRIDLRKFLAPDLPEWDEVNTEYDITGVVSHSGNGRDSGHYVNFAKNAATGKWTCFDDLTGEMTTCELAEVFHHHTGRFKLFLPYLLMFERVISTPLEDTEAEFQLFQSDRQAAIATSLTTPQSARPVGSPPPPKTAAGKAKSPKGASPKAATADCASQAQPVIGAVPVQQLQDKRVNGNDDSGKGRGRDDSAVAAEPKGTVRPAVSKAVARKIQKRVSSGKRRDVRAHMVTTLALWDKEWRAWKQPLATVHTNRKTRSPLRPITAGRIRRQAAKHRQVSMASAPTKQFPTVGNGRIIRKVEAEPRPIVAPASDPGQRAGLQPRIHPAASEPPKAKQGWTIPGISDRLMPPSRSPSELRVSALRPRLRAHTPLVHRIKRQLRGLGSRSTRVIKRAGRRLMQRSSARHLFNTALVALVAGAVVTVATLTPSERLLAQARAGRTLEEWKTWARRIAGGLPGRITEAEAEGPVETRGAGGL